MWMLVRLVLVLAFMILACSKSVDPLIESDREKAPDFTLSSATITNTNNGDISLADFKGKIVYLFFLGYNCPPCIDAAPRTKDIYKSFSTDSVQVLGLDAWNGSISGAANFIIQTGIEYPVLIDAETVAGQYNVIQEYSVIIDKTGHIAYKKSGVNKQKIKDAINTLLME